MIFVRLRELFKCDGYCTLETSKGGTILIQRDLTCSLHSGSTERMSIWTHSPSLVEGMAEVWMSVGTGVVILPRVVNA